MSSCRPWYQADSGRVVRHKDLILLQENITKLNLSQIEVKERLKCRQREDILTVIQLLLNNYLPSKCHVIDSGRSVSELNVALVQAVFFLDEIVTDVDGWPFVFQLELGHQRDHLPGIRSWCDANGQSAIETCIRGCSQSNEDCDINLVVLI